MMKAKLFFILALLVLSFDLHATDNYRFQQLRDQGIKNIGWVAGNASGHPIWPQVEPFVGPGGEYYDVLLSLKTPGADEKVEAYSNVSLYREWKGIGEKIPFNEKACTEKIQRTLQIVDELTELLKTYK